METEAVWCSKLFETVRFYSSSWTASARVGNAGDRGNFNSSSTDSFPTALVHIHIWNKCWIYSALTHRSWGCWLREWLYDPRPHACSIFNPFQPCQERFQPCGVSCFCLSACFQPLLISTPLLQFPPLWFSIKWRAAREAHFQPDRSQIRKYCVVQSQSSFCCCRLRFVPVLPLSTVMDVSHQLAVTTQLFLSHFIYVRRDVAIGRGFKQVWTD